MGRRVGAPTRLDTGIGTWSSLDHGAIGLFYANAVGTFGAVSAGQKLGPSRKRRPPVGAKVGRRAKSVLIIISRRRTFLGGR